MTARRSRPRARLLTTGAWLAAVLACGRGWPAAAQPQETLDASLLERANPLRGLVPSPVEVRASRQRKLESKLENALTRDPRITRAEVVLRLRTPPPLSWDPEPSVEEAQVMVWGPAPEHLDRTVRTLTTALLPDIPANAIGVAAVRLHDPIPTQALAKVGPFSVSPDSAETLRALLASSLAANVLLATAWLLRAFRRRHDHTTPGT